MTRAIVISAGILAACGGGGGASPPDAPSVADAKAPDAAPRPDAAESPDAAPPPALACLGAAPPTTAADPLIARGKVFAVADYHVTALAGVPVTLHASGDDHVLGAATTGADGAFAISIASGGHAIDGYLVADDGVHRPTYAFAGAPLDGAQDALLIVADDAELTRWYADAGDTWSASARTMIAAVTDCTPKSAAASVTASPSPAHLVYYDPAAQRWDASLGASANGFVLLTHANVTETITAQVGSASFPAHTIATRAGAITLAVIPPTL